ncbi:MAG: glutamate--tRNA ligase [Thiogranum sp.]|jgi:glutamyl-tRNA synthetase|nr:glutamate--tRNA ligase [Thiogranum sp.]
MSEPRVKARFAPSPTGEIHLGNLRTALFNFLYAAGHDGVFLLRIEDTDKERSRPEYAQALMDELKWLGLGWQEGPDAGGDHGPYYQAWRLDIYREYYDALAASGAIYPCFCSDTQLKLARKAQRTAGLPPRYPGTCANLSEQEVRQKLADGAKPTWRFRVPAGERVEFDDLVRGVQRFSSDDIGDFIVRRSDGTPAFFFSNAVDDALMGVSHVLRGEDHLTNTPRQLMILRALGLPAPVYGHLSLLVGDDGSPLSKRHGSRSVRQLREEGYMPGGLLNYLARLGHSYASDDFLGLDGLAEGFALQRLGTAPARYDEAQLRYWQKQAVAGASTQSLLDWFRQSEAGRGLSADWSEERLIALLEVVHDNVEMPADVGQWLQRLSVPQLPVGEAEGRVLAAAGRVFFETAVDLLGAFPGDFREFAKAVGAATGARGKSLFMPLRVALTGVTHGPEMGGLWAWLGPDICRERLLAALDYCRGAESDAETV